MSDTDALPPDVQAELRRQITDELWRRGELSYKFHDTQQKIAAALQTAATRNQRLFYFLCSRRLGKTFTLLCLAFEQALKHPNSNILYLSPLASSAYEVFTDVLGHLMKDCPPSLGVEVKEHSREVRFKNGSHIRIKGVNNEQSDNLRGGAIHLIIMDECGQMDRLEYLVRSVAQPATLTTGGRIILATTPPETPGHDSVRLYLDLLALGATVKFTLLDAPESHLSYQQKYDALLSARESPEDIPKILAKEMMPRGTTALREYFCEFVTDANKAVVPEFREAKPHIVRHHPRPGLYDGYVAIDPGQVDKTALVFGIYDFKAGVISIEDEALLHRASTDDITRVLLDTEYALWGDQKPYLRIIDNDLKLINDLRQRHGIEAVSAYKPGSKSAFNLLRTMIVNRELVISPKCTQLIAHLESAVFNNQGTALARSGEGEERHHFDLIDALKYLVRSVNMNRNPYPPNWTGPRVDQWRSRRQLGKPGGVKAGQGRQLDLLGNSVVGRRLKGKLDK